MGSWPPARLLSPVCSPSPHQRAGVYPGWSDVGIAVKLAVAVINSIDVLADEHPDAPDVRYVLPVAPSFGCIFAAVVRGLAAVLRVAERVGQTRALRTVVRTRDDLVAARVTATNQLSVDVGIVRCFIT